MSDKALDHIVEIARLIKDSKIIIMHVIPEIPTPIFSKEIRSPKTGEVITFSKYMVSLYQEMESEIRKKLEGRKEKYTKHDLDIEIYITTGSPIDKILNYATDKKIAVINSILSHYVGIRLMIKFSSFLCPLLHVSLDSLF